MTKHIDIVFDSTIDNQGAQMMGFVEIENDQGESISLGEWVKRADGYHVIRISHQLPLEGTVLDLNELIDSQLTLQAKMGHPTGHGEPGVKENLLHVIIETVEAMREINFKPWKTSVKPVDRLALATELTDILQFWANAANAFGLTPAELTEALRAKWVVNHQRIKDHEVKSVAHGDPVKPIDVRDFGAVGDAE